MGREVLIEVESFENFEEFQFIWICICVKICLVSHLPRFIWNISTIHYYMPILTVMEGLLYLV